MKQNLVSLRPGLFICIFCLLGFFEFSAAAFWILQIDPDPKNAAFLGYSWQRLALFALTLLPGLVLLVFAGLTWQGKLTGPLLRFAEGKSAGLGWLALSLALLALVFFALPSAWLGSWSGYFRRLQPLLFTLCLFPGQLSGLWLFRRAWQSEKRLGWLMLVFSALIAGFWLVVVFSGFGIAPEKEFTTGLTWSNISGTPLTMVQGLLALLGTLAGVAVFKVKASLPGWMDPVTAAGLYLATALTWALTPFKESTFASKLTWPYYQPFPVSDAGVHDLGALSILQGQGIFFGAYTDKPLYMSFLAGLHLLAGYNYTELVLLQICFLALMAPALYFIGKSFHSRPLGILMALVLLLRQRNAILLTGVLYYNAAPNLLMTEVPTLLGLILLTGGWFAWMKKPRAWVALAVGGVLGAVCLIRLNPLLALPVIPVFALLAFGREKKRWAVHSLAYLLGFALLVAPWLVTGTNSDGQSYFLLKFYDVISVRYGAGVLPPEPVSRVPLPPLGGLNSLAKKPPQQEVSQFPGFVINNFMHNLVESFLVLPDSLSPLRQNLSDLEPRFYWKPETFERERLPYVAVNSLLVALGLAWSWRRWKWAGLVPLLSFLVYAFSLALAKTSGSRYLIPIDWLVYFYYGVGILTLLQFFLPVSFLTVFQEAAEPAGDVRSPFRAFGAVLTVLLLLAAVVPAADNLVPQNASLCQPEDLSAQVALRLGEEAVSGLELRKGRVLYPSIEKKVLSFVLFSCHQFTSMKMDAPFDMVNSGALVIAGWPVTEAKSEPLPITLLVPAE